MPCPTCKDSGRPGWVHRSYPAPKNVIYGYSPWWLCPSCNGTCVASRCEGSIGGPFEVTNTGNNDQPFAAD